MANRWQTLEEAALALGVSSRTLHRRLAKGEFQTRLANGRREVLVTVDDSAALSDVADQAEVRQQLSDFARRAAVLAERAQTMRQREPAKARRASDTSIMSDLSDATTHPSDVASDLSDVAPDLSELISNPSESQDESTVLALHEDRIRRTDLAIMAYQQSVNVFANDTRRARFSARLAWGLAGCLIAGGFFAGIWITHAVTRAQAEVDHLHQVVRQLSDTAGARSHEVESLRAQAEAAHLASAKVEEELSATRQELAAQHWASTQPSAIPSGALGPVMARITLR